MQSPSKPSNQPSPRPVASTTADAAAAAEPPAPSSAADTSTAMTHFSQTATSVPAGSSTAPVLYSTASVGQMPTTSVPVPPGFINMPTANPNGLFFLFINADMNLVHSRFTHMEST